MKKHFQLNVIADLLKPLPKKHETGVNVTIEDPLNCNLEFVIQKYSISIGGLKYSCVDSDASWKFVCLSLSMLEELKEKISFADKVEDELISLTERKEISSCVEFVISLGLLPYLLPGVGIPPKTQLQAVDHLRHLESLTHFQKYKRLCVTVRSLLALKDEFIFQSVLIPRFFNDLLAALFQLCFVPLKKPTENVSSTREEITPGVWSTLQMERLEFNQKLESIIASSHQPSLIREIMVIQGNKMCPKWLKLACSKLLSERLIQAGGLRATVSALCDTDFESPVTWKKLEVIARIATSPNLNSAEYYFDKIIPQLLEALRLPSNKENKFESVMKQVSIQCTKLIAETSNVPESKQVLQLIMRPFHDASASTLENDITTCILDLHTCCTFSINEMFRVPPKLLTPIAYRLFLALVKLSNSPLILKNDVKELIYSIICDIQEDETLLYGILFTFLFNDVSYCGENCCVLGLSNLKFELGSGGGLVFKDGCGEVFMDETSSIIIELLMEKDSERFILKKLFIKLLMLVAESDAIVDDFERNLIVIKTLSMLASDEKIQNTINKNPRLVVDFVKSLLSRSSEDSNVEITCLGLMILDVILSNISPSNLSSDKSYFKTLIKPLSKTLETTQNEEIRSLVEGIIGLVDPKADKNSMNVEDAEHKPHNLVLQNSSDAKQISFQEAMHDVCDGLLPVRAHGMMQLTKLIRSKNKEALAKKDVLYCLFKENLKHEDSYMYLSAVEGLASLAAELPDSVLVTLTDEYSTNNSSELRLKVGETLLKCIRNLGDLIPTYKVELLNAFLSGTRDLDPLVRASSLSNLGEVCQLLGFRIGSIVVEILECVSSIISSDTEVEPRRAAVMVITLLLKGLQKDLFHVLETQLLSLYRALKRIYENEDDDVVKLHTQLAIQELNEITREFLFPQHILFKKIHILDIT